MSKLNYRHNGARALVLLHEKHMRSCVQAWREAKAAGITLPETDDTDYESMATLLRHILGAPKGYMTWMCEKLGLPDPQIDPTPEPSEIEAQAEAYLEHLIERWRTPLQDVAAERFNETYEVWRTTLPIEAMLEHAVMHPIRHEFQLRNLLDQS